MRSGFAGVFLASTAYVAVFASVASAREFNIPSGDLGHALDVYAAQTGVSVIISDDHVKGALSPGVIGDFPDQAALSHILSGTGFAVHPHGGGAVAIVPAQSSSRDEGASLEVLQLAQATPVVRAVETVTVTSSKLGGADVQSIPISITALSQDQLTSTQTAGGPDLVKQVPNLTFSKTNFSGYNIQIRGIGTQAISVTTDPAVAVALNDTPFIRNHFFEQEFYDIGQLEVLRGPQGTLYGRNATAGVVNITSAKPTDQFEAMASGEIGNYKQRRFEGMLNIPIVDDRLDIRVAGEWTKRGGYSLNETDGQRIDGRDLWSGRVTIGLKPVENVQMYLVWEHFSENDDRLRSGKQLCKTDPIPTELDGVPIPGGGAGFLNVSPANFLSQGCQPVSLYSPEAFQGPNGFSLPYGPDLAIAQAPINSIDPYASTTQSTNLRVINSALAPEYKAKNDTLEFNADYSVLPSLTFSSQTGFNHDTLYSIEDYNRFQSALGLFRPSSEIVDADGIFCDPQLGCSDRLIGEDLSTQRSWQLSQEFRLASNFSGPLNFSVGGNYLHYETFEDYYVFINTLTAFMAQQGTLGTGSVASSNNCINNNGGYVYRDPAKGGGQPLFICGYIDPNPISSLDGNGHNYFRSANPYVLNSYSGFGEAYYNLLEDLKFTLGLRYTEDRKHFTEIPSWLVAQGWGYPEDGVVDQSWGKLTGRFAANWTPKLEFTDQTLIYGSYAHGYKAGGANPPGAVFDQVFGVSPGQAVHPKTFRPEYVEAFELGTKNTLLDGSLTLNGSVFYYNYKDYQISEIVDRTSVNQNFSAHVKGAEIEATYEPLQGLRLNLSGGYEDTALAKSAQAIDLMDRTAGNADWMVVKPFVTNSSNCILPVKVVAAAVAAGSLVDVFGNNACDTAYISGQNPGPGVAFDPATAPNNGEGFAKDLGGNKLPNAPPFTVSFGAQYSIPVTSDWAATLRSDYYWQDYSWARVFNDNPYDRLRGYTSVNLTLILTNQEGWQVMLYDKNAFNTTAITGAFLNSDDSGLTTNIFLTDPRLIGVRVTKNW